MSLPDSSELRCYTKDQVPHIWYTYEPLIKKGLDRGSNYTLQEVYEGLCSGHMQIWTWGAKACLVTAIHVEESGHKFCLLLVMGGEAMSEWKHCYPTVANWAREQGATELQIYGRVGWARAFGFDIEYAKMVKQI